MRVAPGFTVKAKHAAVATPDVDGAFGVPAAMTAFTAELGTPALQLPAADQFELTLPVQVVWPLRADEPKSRTRTKTKAR